MHPYSVVTDKGFAFVTNTQDDSISIVDLNRGKEIEKIAVGENPENLSIDSNDNQLIVTNWGGDSISIIDLKTYKVIKEVKTGLQSRAFGSFIYQ